MDHTLSNATGSMLIFLCAPWCCVGRREGTYSWLSGVYSQFPGGWVKRKCLYVKRDREGVAVVNS